MDELQMINSLLDKPAPSDAVAAAGRDRLRAAARTPAGRMSARRKPKITLLTGGLGLTAAGAAAWRRDGSPTSFPVPGSKCVLTKRSCAVPKMRPAAASKMPERYGVGRLGNSMLTITQARALPSDPARLKVLLIKRLSGGQVIRSEVILSLGWTDERPRLREGRSG